MPKSKVAKKRPAKPIAAKKRNSKLVAAKKISRAVKPVTAPPPKEPVYSDEYREYLQRYAIAGAGRPRLSPKEFDDLDDELLDLLALETEGGLDDEQIIRLQELEFLLLDSDQ